jgi:hypothetical protein
MAEPLTRARYGAGDEADELRWFYDDSVGRQRSLAASTSTA